MAYLTVSDLDPKMIFVDRDDEYDYSPSVSANQRSFAHPIPLKRVARRTTLHDELNLPLQDYRKMGEPCPVIDTEALGDRKLKELRKFLPKHLVLRTDANGETFIVSLFEHIEQAYEKVFRMIVQNEKRKKALPDYRYWEHDWRDFADYVGMTSAQALRKEYHEQSDYVYNAAPELSGTEYWRFSKNDHFMQIWRWITMCGQRWTFDVYRDAHVPVQLNSEGRITLKLHNHKVASLEPGVFKNDGDQPLPRTVGDLALGLMNKPHRTGRWYSGPDGDIHEAFHSRCMQSWSRGFLGRLRLEGAAAKKRGVKRNLTVVEHDFGQFDPGMPCKAGNSDWMVFGLSLGRGVPSIFSIEDTDHPTQRAEFDTLMQRAYVHHSGGLWRVLFLVPNIYWTSPVRRYQMGTYIAVILEDRDCGLSVTFPVSRGLNPKDKMLIERTPFMSSAIQHALYNLQFLLKGWDRDHTTVLDPFNPSYSLMMPTDDLPYRMQPCSQSRHHQGAWHGTVTQFQRLLAGFGVDSNWVPPISDLWNREVQTSQMQRVARSVAVEDEQMFLDVDIAPTRRRMIKLD